MSKTANQILNGMKPAVKMLVAQNHRQAADGTTTAHPEQAAYDFALDLVDAPETTPADMVEKIHEAMEDGRLHEYTDLDVVAPYDWQRQDLATRYWTNFKACMGETVGHDQSPVDMAVALVFEQKTLDFVHQILNRLQEA